MSARLKMSQNQTNIQLPTELQQQIGVLNARVSNADLVHRELLNTIASTFTAMANTIAKLQQENAELKAKADKTK